MSFWTEYKADTKKETNGVWHKFRGNLELKIARADAETNPEFAKKYQELMAEITGDDQAAADHAARLLYANLITDAKGLAGANGEHLALTVANLCKIFEQLPELYKEVRVVALNFDNYRMKAAIDQLGKSSIGSLTTALKRPG